MKNMPPIGIAFIVVAIDLLGFGMIVPLLPRYAERFQHEIPREWIDATIGGLMSSFSLMQFIVAPLWGKLSDRIGRRPVLLVGLAGSVVFYTLFAVATIHESLLLLFVARIGQGTAGATIGTAQAVIADCTPPEERARGMALIGMAFGIGFTVGPLLGAFAASGELDAPPSSLPGFLAAGICLVGFCLAVFFLPETLRPHSEKPRHWLDTQQLRWALTHRPVALPIATFFLAIIAFAQFEATFARFTKDILSFTDRQNFWVFLYIGAVLTLAQGGIVRRLAPVLGEVRMIIGGIALMLLGIAGIGFSASHASLVVVLAVVAMAVVGFAALTPSVQALISRRSSAAHQGEVLGLNQSAAAIARIIGPVLGNVLYRAQSQSHQTPYYVSACLLSLALALAFSLRADT
jgi:MFS family permease